MKTKPLSLYFLYGWILLFTIIPLSFVGLASFLSHDTTHLVNLPFTVSNYTILFSSQFITVFFRSLLMASAATLGCLMMAYPFSYLLVKSKYQSLLLVLIIIPFWTSSLVRTYALLSILKLNGLVNTVLIKLHIINHPLHLLYTDFAVISGLVYNLFPFMVLPIFTNMERFNFELLDAAKDLGANRYALFFKIFLPNTWNGVVSGCLMTLLPAMTLFYIPTLLGGARSLLLGNVIQNQFLLIDNWPQGSATSVLLTVILMILLRFLRNHNKGN